MAEETPTPTPSANVPENGSENPGAALQNVTGWLDGVRELMSAIVVHERYTISDVYGNLYEFKPALSARRQIEAGLHIDEFLRQQMSESDVEAAARDAADNGGARAVLVYLERAVMDPKIADSVEKIFGSIHPGILARAKLAAKEAGSDDDHLLDLFGLEEIWEALVPFFARFATRVSEVAERMMKGTQAPGSKTSSRKSQNLH